MESEKPKRTIETRYRKIEVLGEGTYGVVFKAFDLVSKQFVALKKIRMEYEEDEGIPATTLREISSLKSLTHPNIVPLQDLFINHNEKKIYLIFDYFEQDLKTFINKLPPSPPKALYQDLLQQILAGIEFCHSSGILHRDLKPQNILVSNNGVLKLADFGLARSFNFPLKPRNLTKEIVTLWYRAPELLLGEKQYSTAIDIWSVGCIFAEIINKTPLFMGDSQIDQIYKIFQFSGTPDEISWPGVSLYPDFKSSFPKFKRNCSVLTKENKASLDDCGWDLLLKMLEVNPVRRINATTALKHQFFFENSISECLKSVNN